MLSRSMLGPVGRRSALATTRSSVRLSSGGAAFPALDTFARRHVGPRQAEETPAMLGSIGFESFEGMLDSAVPEAIRAPGGLAGLKAPATESEALAELKAIAELNVVKRSFIGQGYYGTNTPAVVTRNMLENPAWYTAYTPYQTELSQGRLEMLLNFQTMVSDLTARPIATASLLDEATAAAEAFQMCHTTARGKRGKFFVAADCHPQTIACVQTRADALGLEVVVGDTAALSDAALAEYSGVMVQYPNTYGVASDFSGLSERVHAAKGTMVAATDLLACTQLTPPGELGADIVVGSAQRFGVPMFYGGPHAGFMTTSDKLKRLMPGRLIGVSIDSQGKPALRMALQAREQFIRREKAGSNICTAQALLANVAAAYAVYHGPEGLKDISARAHAMACALADASAALGYTRHGCGDDGVASAFFDTLALKSPSGKSPLAVVASAEARGANVRNLEEHSCVGISVDETTTYADLELLVNALADGADAEEPARAAALAALSAAGGEEHRLGSLRRDTEFLAHGIFNTHRSETQMLRYLASLEKKDLTLRESMIPLGSCTMKLNATSELMPISWPEFTNMHPFAPVEQCEGYFTMIDQLDDWLAQITGFAAVSTQPNSGATGEYAGLLAIKAYHASRGDKHRNICLIPISAHGTNPASATMCGMKVVVVKSNESGDTDMEDLVAKAELHKDNLAALMITYPSTYGKFEVGIKDIIDTVHSNGGQVYMDGANLNAQIGISSPGALGADVCHLNLHKTFCIPHGGGGPGVGSIGVARHLSPFLPGHSVIKVGGEGDNVNPKHTGQVAAAPFGSAGILPISWMYIRMMGEEGLFTATQNAILNANYMAKRLENDYTILFRGANGQCAHEFIVDCRPFSKFGMDEQDIAKRLGDYGFHAPTASWPLVGSLMIEPTESEDLAELDRFCDALISIRAEMQAVMDGEVPVEDSLLKGAPHTAEMVSADEWTKPYSRQEAAYPKKWVKRSKFWPSVGRIDNTYGDRNLVCTCPPMEDYM